YFGQKPIATLSLINPAFNQTGRRHIIVSGAHFVGRTKETRQLSVIVPKFGNHLPGKETPVVGIFDPAMTGDVPDTSQRIPANLARTFSNVIRHDKDLFGVFIKQQMVIAEVPSSDVPVEPLGLHVKGKDIG